MEQGKMGHKGIDNGNIHMMSHFSTIPAIPLARPVRQFNHVLRQ